MNGTANMHKIRVRISELKVAKGDAMLISYGLGSCVGVAIWDADQEVGGLAHVLLPGSPRPNDNPLKFSATAVKMLVDEIVAMGGKIKGMKAKIVGGANMFSWVSQENKKSIGERNVESVLKTLDELGIKVVGRDVGGAQGRTVEFRAGNGEVVIRNAKGEERYI